MSDQPHNCHIDLSWAMRYLPPATLQHNTFNIRNRLTCRVILIVVLMDVVPSPHTTLCSTNEPTWHLESCLKCLFLPLEQDNTLNNTLNRWREFASWVMIEICNSSIPQCNTFNVWKKQLTCGVLFLKFGSPGPNQAISTESTFWPLQDTTFNIVQHEQTTSSHV